MADPRVSPARTVMEVVRLSSGYLGGHGSSSPRLDAELLAAMALGVRRLDLYLQFDRPLDESQLAAVRELVRRRGGGEPVAYITGEREFYGRPFTVTPDVLVPRPETETLVGLAAAEARSRRGGAMTLADLGTGSGCIAVTLALELPDARVVGTDISAAALEVARSNAERHGVSERVEFRLGSWADPVAGDTVAMVVSNPPYVRTGDLAGLDREVRAHEPALALDGGGDGLVAYRELMPSIGAALALDGWAAVEIDITAAAKVTALGLGALPGARSAHHADLSGRPRVVSFERRPGVIG